MGALILASTFVATVPTIVVGAGWLLFVVGLVLAFVFAYRESRRQNASFLAAMSRGLRTLWGWLWAFMP